ncbi:MAB_1171c family putative transporter [Streptomyces sp. NPDC059649]|uniref:MAB_1171c family putative transporter n=1 Tax=Streptomyces sp. NPDC059649 TaxID=3346895 RepID=UPI0036B46B01
MPTGLADYLIAVLISGVALWRAPALWCGDTQRRALCGAYACYGAALWPKTPIVQGWLAGIPITDLAVLLEHYASSAAVVCLIVYVAAGYGPPGPSDPRAVVVTRRFARIVPAAAVMAVIAMTTVFLTGVHRSHTTHDFGVEHAGDPGAAAYMTTFYLLLGATCLVCGYQWGSATRLASSRPLRIGLAVLTAATVLCSAYIVVRTMYLWGAVAIPELRALGPDVARSTAALELIMLVAFASGSSIPTSNAAADRLSAACLLRHLGPLHRDLVAAFPDVAFERSLRRRSALASVPLLRSFVDLAMPVEVRLAIRVHAMADVAEQLRHYAPPELLPAAEDFIADLEESTPDWRRNAQAAAEGVYIRAALVAYRRGHRRAVPSAPLPRKPLVSMEAEARWWRQVQEQYQATCPHQAEKVLDAALAWA